MICLIIERFLSLPNKKRKTTTITKGVGRFTWHSKRQWTEPNERNETKRTETMKKKRKMKQQVIINVMFHQFICLCFHTEQCLKFGINYKRTKSNVCTCVCVCVLWDINIAITPNQKTKLTNHSFDDDVDVFSNFMIFSHILLLEVPISNVSSTKNSLTNQNETNSTKQKHQHPKQTTKIYNNCSVWI